VRMRSARRLTNAARVMERTALDQAPGGGKRERSGRFADATRCEIRTRATGCATQAQAAESTGGRKAHRDSRSVEKKRVGPAPAKDGAARSKGEC